MTDSTWNRGNGRPAQRGLDQALDRVLEHFRPVEVILFGSAARGELHDSSDIELLVVLADGDPGDLWQLSGSFKADRAEVIVNVSLLRKALFGRVFASGDGARDGQRAGCSVRRMVVAVTAGDPESGGFMRSSCR